MPGPFNGGGKMGRNSTQTGAGGPQGTGGASKGTAGGGRVSGPLSSSAADHMVATGAVSAPSIPSSGVARGNYPTQDNAYNDFSKAVGNYATRNLFGKVADYVAGPFYDQKEPMAGNPRSFAGGAYHSSSNPAGVVAGLLAPMGSGAILGPVASKLYGASGLPDVWHGGYDQPDVRTGPFGNAPPGTDLGKTFSQMGGMSNPGGAPIGGTSPNSPGRGDQGGNPMAAFGQQAAAPGGASFGAQPAAQTAQSPMAGFFKPGLPNHTVPQGFNSAFPNSLSDADKAMLYAKALA